MEHLSQIAAKIQKLRAGSGAYVEREVKAYAIFENEVQTICMWNTLAAVFFSAGAGFLSFAVGIWTNWSFITPITPEGAILSHVVAPILVVLALGCSVIAAWSVYSRRQTWFAIRAESKPASTSEVWATPTPLARKPDRPFPNFAT